jgi:hypothetical protein
MSFDREVAFDPPIAQLTAHGSPSLSEWRSALQAVVHDPDLPPQTAILCDLRAVERLPRTAEARRLCHEVLRVLANRTAAFVVPAGITAELTHEVPSDNRAEIQLFTTYEAALRWLVFDAGRRRSAIR